MLAKAGEWAASCDNLVFHKLNAENREDAIKEVMSGGLFDEDDILGHDGYSRCWIGQVYEFIPVIDGDAIIEQMQYDCEEDLDEGAEGYLCDVTNEQEEDLQERLTRVFCEWEDDYRLTHTGYICSDVEKIVI